MNTTLIIATSSLFRGSEGQPGTGNRERGTITPGRVAAIAGLVLMMTLIYQPAEFSGWDESYYMAPLFSVFQDGDLVLQNNLIRFDNAMVYRYRMLNIVNPDGSLWNVFSIGPAVVYSAFAGPIVMFGEPGPGPAPAWVILTGVMALGVLTVLALFHFITVLGFTRSAAGTAVAVAVIASPFANYATRFYLNGHFLSACLAVILYVAWQKWTTDPAVRFALMGGLAGGLLIIVRWQDAVLGLPWIPVILVLIWTDGARRRDRIRGLAMGLAFTVIPVFIQLRAWKIQFDHWIVFPQGSAFMHWTDPRWKSLLFSGYHGLVPWAPGLALGLLGLIAAWFMVRERHHRILVTGMIIITPLIIYVTACADDWWAGDAYGPRRLTSLLLFAALGLAALMSRLNRSGRLIIVLGMAVWACVTLGAYQSGIDDMNVLFTGQVSADHPRPGTVVTDAAGNTGKILREGLVDRFTPTSPGMVLMAALVLVLATGLWCRMRQSQTLQKGLIGITAGWSCLWLILLLIIPGNGPWNRYWLDVINYQPDPSGLEITPDELWETAGVIRAIRHLKRDQIPEFFRMHVTFHPNPFEDLNYEIIYEFSRNPEYQHLIDLPVIMNPPD